MFPRYKMPTVPTDPDLNRNELIRTPLRGDYMGMKCLGLPRTVLEADFLVSIPKSKTHRWSDVTLSMKNMFVVVPRYNIQPPKTRLEKTPMLRRLRSKWFPSFDIFIRTGVWL